MPIIISEEEKKFWESKTIQTEDGPVAWPTMRFPLSKEDKTENESDESDEKEEEESEGEVSYLMTCPNEEAPFIGLKENKNLPNANVKDSKGNRKYKCLPCCYKTNQMDISKSTTYNKCLGIDNRARKEKTNYIVKGDKKLEPQQKGQVNPSFQKLVDIKDKHSELKRLGVSNRNDSFLYCVLMAVSGSKNIRNYDNEVSKLKRKMLEYFNCMRQELYDRSYEDVEKILSDDEAYIDSSLFYRSLEEIYNVNIYVVDMSEDIIETPACWKFHVRYYMERKNTIIVYKNYGYDVDEFPQYELIVSYITKDHNLVNYTFDNNVNKILHTFIVGKNTTVTWFMNERVNVDERVNDNERIGYRNLYKTNYSRLFKIVSQYIDCYGKVRMLNVSIPGEFKGEIFTIMVHPGQPYNLPLMSQNDILRLRYSLFNKYFSDKERPTFKDVKNNALLIKMYDIDEGLYIFIEDDVSSVSTIHKEEPKYKYIRDKNQLGYTERYRKMQKTANIIIFLTEWLYDKYIIEKKDKNREKTMNKFIKKMTYDENFKGDSANYYDITNIKYHLPVRANYHEALVYLSKVCPQFIKGDKMVYYNKTFRDKMIKYIEVYSESIKGTIPKQKSYIKNYFKNVDDFRKDKNFAIFKESRNYVRWLRNNKNRFVVQENLDLDMSFQISPYIVLFKDKYYIIQNIIYGSLESSLNACNIWSTEFFNPGFSTEEIDPKMIEFIPYKIYGINTVGKIILIGTFNLSEKNEKEGIYHEILCYGDYRDEKNPVRYAAMLPLN